MLKRFLIFLFLAIPEITPADTLDYQKQTYLDIEVLGWKVKVNTKLVSGDTSLLKESLGFFGKELSEIQAAVPPKALTFLKTITIWFELSPNPDKHDLMQHPQYWRSEERRVGKEYRS